MVPENDQMWTECSSDTIQSICLHAIVMRINHSVKFFDLQNVGGLTHNNCVEEIQSQNICAGILSPNTVNTHCVVQNKEVSAAALLHEPLLHAFMHDDSMHK